MFLICHVNVFKGLFDFIGGRPSQLVTTFPCMVVIGLVLVEI